MDRAHDIRQFLEWASDQHGRKDSAVNEGGYSLTRSVSIYGNHVDEFPEEDELNEMIKRYVEETS